MTCLQCSTVFEPKHGNARYCSDKCLKQTHLEATARSLQKRLAAETRHCKICGEPFTPKSREAVVCSKKCSNRLIKIRLRGTGSRLYYNQEDE